MRIFQGFKVNLYVDSRATWFGLRITHLESGCNRLIEEGWSTDPERIEIVLGWISTVLLNRTPCIGPRWLQAWEILSGLFPERQEALDRYLAEQLAGTMSKLVEGLNESG